MSVKVRFTFIVVLILVTIVVAQSQTKINALKREIRAVVNERVRGKDAKWPIYSDTEMEIGIGLLSAGDEVTITGWSSLLFQIAKDNLKGFISSSAVNSTREIDSLVMLTKMQFQNDPVAEPPLVFKDSAKADLVVSVNKKEVILGECFVLNLSFNVAISNKVRMRFHDFAREFPQIRSKLLKPDCWASEILTEKMEGLHVGNQLVYPLMKSSYCPIKEGLVVFPAVELTLDRMSGERSLPKVFKSAPITVKVSHGPPIMPSTVFHNYRLFGNFELKDSLFNYYPDWSGNLFYSLEIKGDGLTYPILPPKLSNTIADFNLIGSYYRDTIVNDVYSSRKRFIYRVTVKKEGVIDLRKTVSFKYLNRKTRQLSVMNSTITHQVDLSADGPENKVVSNTSRNLIVLDLSQSMEIEDYQPNRAGAVLNGIRRFLTSRIQCDTRIAVFGKNAILLEISSDGSCYSEKRLDSIPLFAKRVGRGSSLADAIMLGNMLHKSGEKLEKLILISDGDNTAGFTLVFPVEIANLSNIRIYTIGVGNRGIVPFGKDFFGTPNFVENTFEDSLLKQLSNLTGGQYFWAKDASAITNVLGEILK